MPPSFHWFPAIGNAPETWTRNHIECCPPTRSTIQFPIVKSSSSKLLHICKTGPHIRVPQLNHKLPAELGHGDGSMGWDFR
ncbi:hypothetical protein ZHAS_00001886 [Anopheles sinensis]|uniref:Uncharacterized protein n=1 Tax=Anopheles sinensis TaxID=74873 RepID=A0A084VBM6_ANOSI|nr:hypothetical protein ZHAS_00001886 [Anopheles sinensis]